MVLRRGKWPECRKCGYEISWCEDILETVAIRKKVRTGSLGFWEASRPLLLSHFPTRITIATSYKNTLILVLFLAIDKLHERRMALYKHVHIQLYPKAIAQLLDTCSFALSATVGKKYKGDTVGLEVGEGAVGTRKRVGAAEEDAINT